MGEVTKQSKDLRVFNATKLKVEESIKNLSEIKIVKSKDNAEAVISTLKEAASVPKLIDAKRKEITKPFNDKVKAINAYAKSLSGELPNEVLRVKGLLQVFQVECKYL